MGQKVSPLILRIGYIKNWNSIWYAKPQDYYNFLEEDFKIRRHIKNNFKQAAVAKIVIERLTEKVRVKIHTARPGVIIGRHRADIEKLSEKIKEITKNKEVSIDIREIKRPATEAQLVAENIAFQLEKRQPAFPVVCFSNSCKNSSIKPSYSCACLLLLLYS